MQYSYTYVTSAFWNFVCTEFNCISADARVSLNFVIQSVHFDVGCGRLISYSALEMRIFLQFSLIHVHYDIRMCNISYFCISVLAAYCLDAVSLCVQVLLDALVNDQK